MLRHFNVPLHLLSLDTVLSGSLPNLPVTIPSEAMNHFSTGDHSDISSLNTVDVTLDIPSGIQTFRIACMASMIKLTTLLPFLWFSLICLWIIPWILSISGSLRFTLRHSLGYPPGTSIGSSFRQSIS